MLIKQTYEQKLKMTKKLTCEKISSIQNQKDLQFNKLYDLIHRLTRDLEVISKFCSDKSKPNLMQNLTIKRLKWFRCDIQSINWRNSSSLKK